MEAWDVVVVGSGPAALRAAIAASEAGVTTTVLCPGGPSSGGTGADAGLAASMNEPSSAAHAADTTAAGAGLSEPGIVAMRTGAAVDHLAELERWGLVLRRDGNGLPHLGEAPGNSVARVANAGDASGREVLRILEEQCIKRRIFRRFDVEVLDLVMEGETVRGLVCFDVSTGEVYPVQAKAVILAGEGGEGAWHTTGPGNGACAAMALRAGVPLADMEFATQHPLTIADTDLALSMDVLGAGARLLDGSGAALALDVTPDALSRSIAEGGALDATGIDRAVKPWFANMSEALLMRAGLDLAADGVPLAPRTHFTVGGLMTDEDGNVVGADWSAYTGLFAAGDAACSGLHGASMSAGNRLLDEIDGGARAGGAAALFAGGVGFSGSMYVNAAAVAADEHIDEMLASAGSGEGMGAGALRAGLAGAMSKFMGASRDAAGLATAEATIAELRQAEASLADGSPVMNTELIAMRHAQGLLAVASAAIKSATARTESRGAHQRADHAETDEGQAHHNLVYADGTVTALPLQ